MQRDGMTLHHDIAGSGPVLLLTHGFRASSAMWRDNVPALVAAGWRVVTWDLRGHGRSAQPDDPNRYTPELALDDMDALLDLAGAETAVIGGQSLGGYLSLAYHRTRPERVRGLLLVDTGPGFKKDAPREAWNDRARARGDKLLANGEVGHGRAAQGLLTQSSADVINSLPDIAVPTLVVVGARDEPFLAASDYMAKKIPGATKVTIADAGHDANVDQPEAFNRAALAFLATVPATPT